MDTSTAETVEQTTGDGLSITCRFVRIEGPIVNRPQGQYRQVSLLLPNNESFLLKSTSKDTKFNPVILSTGSQVVDPRTSDPRVEIKLEPVSQIRLKGRSLLSAGKTGKAKELHKNGEIAIASVEECQSAEEGEVKLVGNEDPEMECVVHDDPAPTLKSTDPPDLGVLHDEELDDSPATLDVSQTEHGAVVIETESFGAAGPAVPMSDYARMSSECGKLVGEFVGVHPEWITKNDLNPRGSFACNICPKSYCSKKGLVRHKINFHMEKRVYPCDVCDKVFKDLKERRLHMNNTHSMVCEACGRTFSKWAAYKEHKKVHQPGVLPFICEICGTAVKHRSTFRKHKLLHERKGFIRQVQVFNCGVCQAKFYIEEIKNRHEAAHAHQDVNCHYCDCKYDDILSLYKHNNVCHGYQPRLPCRYCAENYRTMPELVEHLIRSHRDDLTMEDISKFAYCCYICENAYTDVNDLQAHFTTAHSDVMFMCGDCSESFGTQKELQQHEMIIHQHGGQKSFMCGFCGERYSVSAILCEHIIERHPEHAKFGCPDCTSAGEGDVSFKTLAEFKQHVEAGHGDKLVNDITCSSCFANFAFMDSFQKHCEYVKNYKLDCSRFSCSFCSAQFSKRSDLLKHKTTYHSPDVPMCSTCGRTFSTFWNLKQHVMSMHKGARPYSCGVCGKSFTRASSLNVHMRLHLNVEVEDGHILTMEVIDKSQAAAEMIEVAEMVEVHGCEEDEVYVANEQIVAEYVTQ